MYIHPPNGLTPSAFIETGRLSLPIWACWRWGLPCRDCHQSRGALLPHHFTLTKTNVKTSKSRNRSFDVLTFSGFDVCLAVFFLWHFPSGCPGLALPTTAPYPVRTFLPHERTSKLAMPVALNACTVPAIAFARSTNGIVVRRMTFVDVTYFGSTKASPFRH